MRKTIKSGADIKNEIKTLFENYTSDADLCEKINHYLNNLTGKELCSKFDIKSRINIEIGLKIQDGTIKINKNSPLSQFYPRLLDKKIINKSKNINKNSNPFLKNAANLNALVFTSKLINLMKVDGTKENENEIDQSNNFSNYKFNDDAFVKLLKFLHNNDDVAEMLNDHLLKTVREAIIDLIIGNIIPLKTLLIFFNHEKDIKQNTIALYGLCRKKIPRINIQQVITDNINSIRAGKFQYPFYYTDILPYNI